MRQVIWSALARRDLLSIALHYGRIDSDLVVRLLRQIDRAPIPLLDYPELGEATSRRNTRKWPAKGTPYLLFYGVKGDVVQIKRVRHAAQDWRSD